MGEEKDCEVCGTGNARIFAIVERVRMRVCEKCSKFGKVVGIEKDIAKEKKQAKQLPGQIEVEEEIAEDYADRIMSAREKKGLTREELGKQINEKESFLKMIEAGASPPTDAIAKKLERALGIKLYEVVEISMTEKSRAKAGQGTTLGDLIEIKKKKK